MFLPAARQVVDRQGELPVGASPGADSIDDMDLLRHGAMPDLFGGIRAPSTLGSHLRSFTWGNALPLGLPLAGLFWLLFGWTVALAWGKLWVWGRR